MFVVGAGGFDATQVGGSGVQSETKAEVFSIVFILYARREDSINRFK